MQILMIGNSYTFYNNLPEVLEALGQNRDENFKLTVSLRGGKDWQWHWEEGEARHLLEKQSWDVVFLQNHSRATLDFYDTMCEYGQRLKDAAGESRVILYMTWARQYEPEKISSIAKGYQDLAQTLHAEVTPVGLAWQRVLSTEPSISLYTEDQSHPTPEGSYIALCVLYGTLFQTTPSSIADPLPGSGTPLHEIPAKRRKILRTLSTDACLS